MGVEFLRKQAKGFRHRHNAAFNRLQIPNLISATRQDIMTREFRCECRGAGAAVNSGDEVVLHRQGGRVDVLAGNRVVGAVDDGESASLEQALDMGCGVLRARVSRRSAIAPSFVVQLEVLP